MGKKLFAVGMAFTSITTVAAGCSSGENMTKSTVHQCDDRISVYESGSQTPIESTTKQIDAAKKLITLLYKRTKAANNRIDISVPKDPNVLMNSSAILDHDNAELHVKKSSLVFTLDNEAISSSSNYVFEHADTDPVVTVGSVACSSANGVFLPNKLFTTIEAYADATKAVDSNVTGGDATTDISSNSTSIPRSPVTEILTN